MGLQEGFPDKGLSLTLVERGHHGRDSGRNSGGKGRRAWGRQQPRGCARGGQEVLELEGRSQSCIMGHQPWGLTDELDGRGVWPPPVLRDCRREAWEKSGALFWTHST